MTPSTHFLRIFPTLKQAFKDTARHWLFILTFGLLWMGTLVGLDLVIFTGGLDLDGSLGLLSATLAWLKLLLYIACVLIGSGLIAIFWHRMLLRADPISKALKSPPVFRYVGVVLLCLLPMLIIAGSVSLLKTYPLYVTPSPFLSLTITRSIDDLLFAATFLLPDYLGPMFATLMCALALPQVALGRKARFFASFKFTLKNTHKIFAISLLVSMAMACVEFLGARVAYRALSNSHFEYSQISDYANLSVTFLGAFVTYSLLSRISEIWRPIDSAE